jgi:hypothetical protein
MKNEIQNINELKGKTISDLKLDCGELWLKFTDNTFAVLVVNDITEGFGYTKNEVNINQYSKDNTDYSLVDLGLISENEYKQACEKEEIEYQKRQDERDIQENKRIKNIELEQLEKLKSKYGL